MLRKGMTEFRVGLFVAAGLLLAMIFVFMIGSEHKFFERYYTLYANFEDISGLRIGAPVHLAGLSVGFVDDIRFPDELERKEITVVVRIKKEFQDRIRADSMATIETQGLLGDKFIYLSMGSEVQAIVPNKGIIGTKETTSIFALAEKAGEIMEDIAKASSVVTEMLGSVKGTKGEGDLKAIISSVRNMVEQSEKGRGLIHAVIYDPKGGQAVADFAEAMKSIRDIASGAERGSKGEVGGLITNLRRASADLSTILGAVRRGEGTLGKLVSDPALYDDLRTLAGRANRNRLLKAVIRTTMRENDKQMEAEPGRLP